MEVIGIIIVQYTFSLLGALVRFIVLNFISIFKDLDFISFQEIWKGKGNKRNNFNNEFVNTIIGLILFFILASLIVKNHW